MNEVFAGIDVGGTSVKWIVVAAGGEIVDQGSQDTHVDDVAHQVADIGLGIASAHPTLRSFGVICPGLVDEVHGEVVFASNLRLDGVRLGDQLAERTGLPVRVGHDGRAAGIAEQYLGAGRGVDSFIMIPIGTGISAAVFSNDSMISGHTFAAGEIGHTPIFPGGELCKCGQYGCLEVYAAAKGIARRYKEKTGEDIGAKAVQARLGQDAIADEVWDTGISALALSLTHLTLAIDPELFIIGGGLSRAGEQFFVPLRQKLQAQLNWRRAPRIVAGTLGDMGGRWGATILASREVGSNAHESWTP